MNSPNYPVSPSFTPTSDGVIEEGEELGVAPRLVSPNLSLIFFGGSSPGLEPARPLAAKTFVPRSGRFALLASLSRSSSSSSSRRRFSPGFIPPMLMSGVVGVTIVGKGLLPLERTNDSSKSSSSSSGEGRRGGIGGVICRLDNRGLESGSSDADALAPSIT